MGPTAAAILIHVWFTCSYEPTRESKHTNNNYNISSKTFKVIHHLNKRHLWFNNYILKRSTAIQRLLGFLDYKSRLYLKTLCLTDWSAGHCSLYLAMFQWEAELAEGWGGEYIKHQYKNQRKEEAMFFRWGWHLSSLANPLYLTCFFCHGVWSLA